MVPFFPDDRRYADSHETVKREGKLARLGLSAFAVDHLGDIVFVELPEVGAHLQQGASFGSVECGEGSGGFTGACERRCGGSKRSCAGQSGGVAERPLRRGLAAAAGAQ